MSESINVYTVRRYSDGVEIGTSSLTDAEYRHYEAMAQQPQGIIRLGALPHDYYELAAEYQDTGEDVVVYLD